MSAVTHKMCSSSSNLRSYNLQQCDATPRTPLGELTGSTRPHDWILGRGKVGGKERGKGEEKGEGGKKWKERKRKEAHDVQLAVHGSKHQRHHVESIVGPQVDQPRHGRHHRLHHL